MIARRKRLLEDFLRRVVRHPILGGEHVLHRFLEDGVSWVRNVPLLQLQLEKRELIRWMSLVRGDPLPAYLPPAEEPPPRPLTQPNLRSPIKPFLTFQPPDIP